MCAMDSLIRTYIWAVLFTGILGMPVPRTHIEEGPNHFVAKGSTINLTCIIDESSSPDSVDWLHDGREMSLEILSGKMKVSTEAGSIKPLSRLQIQNAEDSDSGKYSCQPKNTDPAHIWVHVLDGSIAASMEPSNQTNDYLKVECDRRYHKHYEIKGCQVKLFDSRGCPKSYSCPSPANSSISGRTACIYQNTEYEVGAKIELNDRCRECRCVNEANPRISCTQTECPPLNPPDGLRDCHLVYEELNCCPIRYKCMRDGSGNYIDGIAYACSYKNELYPSGSNMYDDEDPCTVCECNRNWKGADNSSCYQKECVMEKDRHHLDAGCVPVYQEKECCPVEYYCPETSDESLAGISDSSNEEIHENSDQCYFAGKPYDVGAYIPVNNSCVKCRCQFPPDITCIHQTCPRNTENCPLSYRESECCPIYNCIQGDESIDSTTEDIETICPTPLCAHKYCVIGTPPDRVCPTCICDEAPEGNDVESSHEKNDLEPLLEELEPQYMEVHNETQNLDNEIPSSPTTKSFSERESLSSMFRDDIPQKDNFEGEKIRNPKFAPEIALLNEEESIFNETEFQLEGTTLEYNIHAKEDDNSTGDTYELRTKRSETGANQLSNSQQQWNVLQQQDQFIDDSEDSGGNSERELEGNDEEISEIKILSTKTSNDSQKSLDELVELDDNELENVIWTSEVSGCPAPMCADSTCRIGIPQGHTCPTCVCKKRRRQP